MNRLLFYALLTVLAFLFVAVLSAQPSNPPPAVTLAWTPSASPASNVMGYWIWQGNASSNYSRVVFVPGWGSSQVTLTNLARGSNYFWNITAIGGWPMRRKCFSRVLSRIGLSVKVAPGDIEFDPFV